MNKKIIDCKAAPCEGCTIETCVFNDLFNLRDYSFIAMPLNPHSRRVEILQSKRGWVFDRGKLELRNGFIDELKIQADKEK
jgi:hypothetical protein